MDNFGAILGADFTIKAKVEIFLHCHGLIIYGGDQSCFVQGSPQETTSSQLILAHQLQCEHDPKHA